MYTHTHIHVYRIPIRSKQTILDELIPPPPRLSSIYRKRRFIKVSGTLGIALVYQLHRVSARRLRNAVVPHRARTCIRNNGTTLRTASGLATIARVCVYLVADCRRRENRRRGVQGARIDARKMGRIKKA